VNPTHYKYVSILALITTKMATRVSELRQWLLYNKITFIKSKCNRWSY